MRTQRHTPRLRWLGWGLSSVLALALVGDTTRAQTATDVGIDPLQVLDLQIVPQAVVVLDSSGSMQELTANSSTRLVGDDPNARMFQAKEALTEVITENQTKVRFLFGRYTQSASSYGPERSPRFLYMTTDTNGSLFDNLNTVPSPFRVKCTAVGVPDADCTAADVGKAISVNKTGYYRSSTVFRNGQTISSSTGNVTATGAKTNPPTLKVTNGTRTVTFTFVGIRWQQGNDGGSVACQGFYPLTTLADCGQFDQISVIGPHLQPELLHITSGANVGDIDGYNEATGDTSPTFNGIRASGMTPIAGSLASIKTWFDGNYATFTTPKPKTFVIVLTDGDDTCAGSGDAAARAAAYRAEVLYNHAQAASTPTRSVTTFVVAFGTGSSKTRADMIAWGGDGLNWADNGSAWTTNPTATNAATGCRGGQCRGAMFAADKDELIALLSSAVNQGANSGTFAAAPTVTENVWEYWPIVETATVKVENLGQAYVPLAFQPTFDASNWAGNLTTWASQPVDPNDPDGAYTVVQKWDASSKLDARVTISQPTRFVDLHAGATPANVASSSALIKRRIYTSSRNGVFSGSAPAALWPPDPAIAPTATGNPAGALDAALGIVGGGDAAEFASLQTRFKVCLGTPLPAGCTSATIATKIAQARREAREMILAFTAGAAVSFDASNNPVRVPTGSTGAGEILYVKRGNLMAETTLAMPAVVTPAVEQPLPAIHPNEYKTYAAADNATSSQSWKQYTGMTVAYLATNQMLHAFRAGPCATSSCSDTGGEELWGFVPFDQLGKLAARMQPQKRENHAYSLAAPLRFAEVFDASANTPLWRRILYFGRGIGGKHLTALDISHPGRVTTAALSSQAPLLMWSRGNPDTQDGTAGGTRNGTNADKTAYAAMGQTWSVPAVVPVNPDDNDDVEFVAYVGSGYSNVATEGSTFYALDALTGGVLGSYDVGDRGGMSFENAIVASPAAYQEKILTPDSVDNAHHPSGALASKVYVGDIHGRLWVFPTKSGTAFEPPTDPLPFADLGAEQPIGVAVALLAHPSTSPKPHIYLETGAEKRIRPPGNTSPFVATPPFRLYGLVDEDLTTDPDTSDGVSGPARVLFVENLTNNPPPGYRGTVQPLTAFTLVAPRVPRVFFTGVQFTPAGSSCSSRFDSRVYALTGINGNAAFDLSVSGDDKFFDLTGDLVNSIQLVWSPDKKGELSVSKGQEEGGAPQAPPPPTAKKADAGGQSVMAQAANNAPSVCR